MVYPETIAAYRDALKRIVQGGQNISISMSTADMNKLLSPANVEKMEEYRIKTGGSNKRRAPLLHAIDELNASGATNINVFVRKGATDKELLDYWNSITTQWGYENLPPVNPSAVRNPEKLKSKTFGLDPFATRKYRANMFVSNIKTVVSGLQGNADLRSVDPNGVIIKNINAALKKGAVSVYDAAKGGNVPKFETINYQTGSAIGWGALRDFLIGIGARVDNLPQEAKNRMVLV